jgi:hypothetical protein
MFTLSLIFIIILLFINKYFSNPYPCTASCIGCESMREMISDNWISWISAFGILISLGVMCHSVVREDYSPEAK